MSLTLQEEKRIQEIEEILSQLKTLITKAASTRSLNRLLVLAKEENRRIEMRQDTIDTNQEELMDLVKKLQ